MNSAVNVRSEFDRKVRKGIFKPVARFLHEDAREDRLQDAIAQTFEMYDRYAARGTILPDAILVHSCRQRAIDLGRNFVKADGTQPKRDVYEIRNYLSGRVALHRIDLPDNDDDDHSAEGDRHLQLAMWDEFRHDPSEHMNSALDASSWLAELDEPDRDMMQMRVEGFTLGETADVVRQSLSAVFSRTKQLGKELAARAEIALPKKRRSRRPAVMREAA